MLNENSCVCVTCCSIKISTNPQKLENLGVFSNGFVENKKIKLGPVTFFVISGVFAVAGLGFVSVWVRRKWGVAVKGKTEKEENVDQEVRPENGQKGKFALVDEGCGLKKV
ncbi:Protein kinase domain-containing protein [Abeliophyllum distichum]|uniref:Protein kinase domain-containing protein n=1 Tax=Abeliophyllum distichum TaxID=126358 RepID=A0ABD1UGX8_9LAMI